MHISHRLALLAVVALAMAAGTATAMLRNPEKHESRLEPAVLRNPEKHESTYWDSKPQAGDQPWNPKEYKSELVPLGLKGPLNPRIDDESAEDDDDGHFWDMAFLNDLKKIIARYMAPEPVPEPISNRGDTLFDDRELKVSDEGVSLRRSVLPVDKRKHHSQGDIERIFRELSESKCPSIMRMHSAGKSTLGEEMWYLEVSDNVGVNEPGEPEVRYVGNMHGNEVVGRELCLWVADFICDSYSRGVSHGEVTADMVRWLVDNTHIYIMPSMNPDGYLLEQRANAHDFDLNRNFPDQFVGGRNLRVLERTADANSSETVRHQRHRQKEVSHMMRWSQERTFMLSANFHGGDVVVNYPWDGNKHHHSGTYAAAPDDRHFKGLAMTYAAHNPDMMANPKFENGITNGAAWYVLYGGYQDWTYLTQGDMQLTIELSKDKWPSYNGNRHGGADPYQKLEYYWETNCVSVFRHMAMAHRGIKGFVKDAQGRPVTDAIVRVYEYIVMDNGGGRKRHQLMDVRVDPETGDYHRFLLPGSYEIAVLRNDGEVYPDSGASLHHFDIEETARGEEFHPTHRQKHTHHLDQAIVHNFTIGGRTF